MTFLEDDFDVKGTQESDIDNYHLYTGRERDPETGLQLNRRRWYHAALGRWVSRDPLEYDGSINLYRYVLSNPLILTDAFGLQENEKPWYDPGFPGFGINISHVKVTCPGTDNTIWITFENCSKNTIDQLKDMVCGSYYLVTTATASTFDQELLNKLIEKYFGNVSEAERKQILERLLKVKKALENTTKRDNTLKHVFPGFGSTIRISCRPDNDGNYAEVTRVIILGKPYPFKEVKLCDTYFTELKPDRWTTVYIHELLHIFADTGDDFYWDNENERWLNEKKIHVGMPTTQELINSSSPYEWLIYELWLQLKKQRNAPMQAK